MRWPSSRTTDCSSSRPPPPSAHHHRPDDLIGILCKHRRFTEALQAFHSLRPSHLLPGTYAHLLLACSRLKSLRQGRLVHRHLSASHPDVVLHNHVLNMYGKCGSPADARKLFDAMPDRNLVSWTSLISGCSQNHQHRQAVELYLDMLRAGLIPDEYALGSTVRACSGLHDIELGRQLHCHVIKFKFDHGGSGSILKNALVTMYSKSGRIADAYVVFERNAEKDLVSWGSMIAGFAQQGCEPHALILFKEMIRTGGNHRPNEFHFGSAFTACGTLLQLEYGKQLHNLCLKVGMESNTFAGCSLSEMYARCGRLDCAKKAFYQIYMPDIVSWNAIIGAFTYGGVISEGLVLFSEMRYLGLQPDDITILCLLRGCTSCSSLCQGQLIHSYIVKTGLGINVSACNALLLMYANCSGLLTALDLFEETKSNRDLVSWNTILTACLQNQHLEEVFRLFRVMCRSNSEPDQITLSITLSACADLACQELGNQVHAYALKSGLEADLMVRNALIDTYTKCGSLDDARKLFQSMGNNCDVFSWSSLIVGYAQFGCAKESFELFTQMQNLGIRPNHVTFIGILTACSHVGSVDEGCRYYNMMEAEYGIVPTREHCSCVIDMLARAGRLSEAERFMDKMPFEPDIVIWKTLLSACKVHKNVEIGKRAAEGILKIDPSNSAAYVLLCNIYASSSCWDDVARIRKLMKSRDVRKSPGKSSIKVKGEVNVFIVDDRSHPEAESIYAVLELLGVEMTEADDASKPLSWNELIQT